LSIYVDYCSGKDVFGREFISYNVHSLLHICEDAQKFGDIVSYSAFPFESFLGHLKALIHSPTHPLQQVARRLHERDYLYEYKGAVSQELKPCGYQKESDTYLSLEGPYCSVSTIQKDSFFVFNGG